MVKELVAQQQSNPPLRELNDNRPTSNTQHKSSKGLAPDIVAREKLAHEDPVRVSVGAD